MASQVQASKNISVNCENTAMADFETKPKEEKRRNKKRKLRSSEENERDLKTFRIVSPEKGQREKTLRIVSPENEKKQRDEEIEEQRERNQNLKSGGPWSNLDLILSLQNKELDLQRKVELAFDFVKSRRTNKVGDDTDGGLETVSFSRLIVFLNDWIQSLLISPDKKIKVEGKKPRSGVMEACLDYRCWEIFKLCLEESSKSQISLSFSPNLLRTLSLVARDALSILDGKESVFVGEGFELYSILPDCVSMLFSSHGKVLNANVDLWSSIVTEVLALVCKTYSIKVTDDNTGSLLLRFSSMILERFANYLRVHPSPKNIFPVFVDRILEPSLSLLVELYLQTNDLNPTWTRNLLKMLEDILSNGLFHPSHVPGFLSTELSVKKVKDSKTVIKSYHRHFFKKLEKFMAEKKMSSLGGIGELFHLFVSRVKKQKGVSTLSEATEKTEKTSVSENTNSSSRLDVETSKSLFDLFARFVEPLVVNLKEYSEIDLEVGSGSRLLDAYCFLKSTNKILSSFMHEKIYLRTEDTTEEAHRNFLKDVYQTVLSFSAKIHLAWLSASEVDKVRAMDMLTLVAKEIIVSLGYFLEIEYEVIENDLVSLWLIMFAFSTIDLSLRDSPDRCLLTSEILHLGCQLINVYSELRQVNNPIFSLCKAIRLFGFCDKSDELDYSKFISRKSSLSSEACVKSVAMLLCSQEFRLAICNAIKSIPEGQASGCIRQLKMDISESLEWMNVNSSMDHVKEFGEPHLRSLQAELLGRALSEIYSIVLDYSVVTTGNCILVGNSIKDLMTVVSPSLSCLVGKQPDSINDCLLSVTGYKNGSPTLGTTASWIFLFFFHVYISCRSLYRQSIGLMPPDSSRKTSVAMGDFFTAYSGKDWMERTDWKDEGYFSWIIKPSDSLLTVIQSVADINLHDTVIDCAPLIYVLHVMAIQRLVDLNRQVKSFEFLLARAVRLVEMKLTDDIGLPLCHKEVKKWKKILSVLKKEAEDITCFLMGYLSLIVKKVQFISTNEYVTTEGKDDAWDLGVCSVTEKLLPTAIWWILCQNIDIWCAHATKKKLKKFLSCLFHSSLSCVSSSGDVGKQSIYEPKNLGKVTLSQISLDLLSDTVFYEQSFLCRLLTSRFCHVLEKSVLPLFSDSLLREVDFNSFPDWQEVISQVEEMPLILNKRHVPRDVLSEVRMNPLPCNSSSMKCGKELTACQSLLNLLCWMPKGYGNLRSFSVYSTYILNLERLVVLSLLGHHGELDMHSHHELFRLFVYCRKALKCLVMAYCEEKIEVRQSSSIPIFSESSFSILWLLKSLSAVVRIMHMFSEEDASQAKYLIFSLMDHTSYVFLALSKSEFSIAVHSVLFDEKPQTELLLSGEPRKADNLKKSDPKLEFSEHFDTWKIVIHMAETLKEQTQSLLISLKANLHSAKLETCVSVVDLNKLSSIISCFQGFLWGLASVFDDIDEKCPKGTKPLRWRLGPNSKLNLCITVFENFVNFCLHALIVEDHQLSSSLCDNQSHPMSDCNNDSLSSEKFYRSSLKFYEGKIEISSGQQQENFQGRMDDLAPDVDDDHGDMGSRTNGVKSSRARKKKLQSDYVDCAINILTQVDSFEREHLKKPLLRSLLKGENPDLAFSLRQLFIASSAILRLKLQICCNNSLLSSMSLFIGTSQFLLSELADMVAEPHPFSFVWLDGVLKYIEVLGSYVSLTNPTSSRNLYARLINIHLRAIGRCISLQGKGATLTSHDTESSTKTLRGQMGSPKLILGHGSYSLDEFKARLRMSFKVFIKKPPELHLLTALQALERALVGVQEGFSVIYEINAGGPDGGNVSSIVAAAVDCLDLVLESVAGRKRLNVVKRHIQSFIGALFNIVLHLQGPLIFYEKLTCIKDDTIPDPGSVTLMCVEVLAKVAGKHSLFQMDPCHVGLSLRVPAALFQDFLKLRSSQDPFNSLMFSANQDSTPVVGLHPYIVDQQFSVDLFSACCRLLCSVLRHHKSESARCISLLENSVCVLLHCLEMVDTDLAHRNGYFAWDLQEGIQCACFLRRIYEEIKQQKEVLGPYCFHFLSNYIRVYSGYGPFKTGIRREIDEALRPGVYALIDACSPDDLQQIHTVLGEGPCRSTLATLQHDYKLNYQYEGKV